MEVAILVIGILLVAGWAGRNMPKSAMVLPTSNGQTPPATNTSVPSESLFTSRPGQIGNPFNGTSGGLMTSTAPIMGYPATMALIPGDPTQPGTTIVGQPIIQAPSASFVPTVGNPAPGVFDSMASGVDQFAASGGITPSASGSDKLTLTYPNGSQLWTRTNGDNYVIWPSNPDQQRAMNNAGIML